jgi:uncharacterized protein YndB with AHSA1/START domain
MVPERIEHEILIDAPLEVVWAVVTEPEQVGAWFSDTADIDLRPGGRATLVWREYGTVHGWVEAVEPPRFFSFRWIRGPGTELRDGNSTLVEFSLSPEGEGTRLRVVESGFRGLDASDDEKARDVEGHRKGWELELGELDDYVRQRVRPSPAR